MTLKSAQEVNQSPEGPKKSRWATMIETSQAIDRVRHGKTHKDHSSGSHKKNKDNVIAREAVLAAARRYLRPRHWTAPFPSWASW